LYWPSYIQNVAESLGFTTSEITGNTIVESDLSEADILLVYYPTNLYYSQDEISLREDFLQRGGGLYLLVENGDTGFNILWEEFGFKLTGGTTTLNCPYIKNVTFTHPTLEGVNEIEVNDYFALVATLSLLVDPAKSILTAEGVTLFLVSSYGGGRIFVDLTVYGLGSLNKYDNLRVVQNVLVWLMGVTSYRFPITVYENSFNITISNSIISSFDFEKNLGGRISYRAMGLLDSDGFCNVTIPRGFMWCDMLNEWNLTVDGLPPSALSISENNTHTSMFFSYPHSVHDIRIISTHVIPESPSLMIVPLFMIATLLAVMVYKRKRIAIK
jgi:hypothetical protein